MNATSRVSRKIGAIALVMSASSVAIAAPFLAASLAPKFDPMPNIPTGYQFEGGDSYNTKMACGVHDAANGATSKGYLFRSLTSATNSNLHVVQYSVTATGWSNPSVMGSGHQIAGLGGDFSVASLASFQPNRMFVIGGYASPGTLSNMVYRYNPTASIPFAAEPHYGFNATLKSQPNITVSVPGSVGIGGVGAVGLKPSNATPKVLMVGGYTESNGNKTAQRTVLEFDPTSGKYVKLADLPMPLAYVKILPFAGNGGLGGVYVVGGTSNPNNPNNLSSLNEQTNILRYDYANDTWQVLNVTLPLGTDKIAVSSVGGRMIVFGRNSASNYAEMQAHEFFHPTSGSVAPSVKTFTYNIPARTRTDFAMLGCGPGVWIVGGYNGKQGPTFSNRGRLVDRISKGGLSAIEEAPVRTRSPIRGQVEAIPAAPPPPTPRGD